MGKIVAECKEKVSSPAKSKKMAENKEPKKMYTVKYTKKKKTPYFSDPMLIPRVEDYLEDNKDNDDVNIDVMVEDLRKTYKDYSRKKLIPFKTSVEKAYSAIMKRQMENMSDEDDDDELEGLEDEDEDEEDIGIDDEDEDIGLDDDDEEEDMLGLDDEELDLEEDNDMFTGIKSNNKRQSTSVIKPTQRNGTELINISSDESDAEPQKKKESSAFKISQKVKSLVSHKVHLNKGKYEKDSHSHSSHNHVESFIKKKQPTVKNANVNTPAASTSTPTAGKCQVSLMFPVKTRVCVEFNSVAGCDNILKDIRVMLMHLVHPEVYQHLGVSGPRGFLLHGPPGTGKTLIARAIAGEMKLPLIQVAAPELIRGVSGSSEERIRSLFDQAVSLAPCIVFIDEIDVITPNRDATQRDMERRIVGQLLASIDDLNNTHNGNKILLIGATSRLDAIDPALRRSGRFDREISLGIPDRQARKAILALTTRRLKMDSGVSLDELATITPGFVGSDLRALVCEAATAAIKRIFYGTDKPVESESCDSGNPEASTLDDVEMSQAPNCPSTSHEKSGGSDDVENDKSPGKREVDAEDDNVEQPITKKQKLDDEPCDNSNKNSDSTTVENKEETEEEGQESSPSAEPKDEDASKTTNSNSTKENENKEEIDIINVEEYVLDLKNAIPEMQSKLRELLKGSQPLNYNEMKVLAVEMRDFKTALKTIQPSAKREGFATVPDVTWDDVGSLKEIRSELEMTIMGPVHYPNSYATLGLSASSGVLLCGPPGCGKTLLAKAIANEAGINFISVKGPELLNMYVGESERGVRQCFQRARNSQPCVIFFDELDALCPKRSDSNETSVTMRVVNQLLTEMDGVEGRKGVFVLAATNRPDIIDPAIMRPGRLDKIIFIGLPSFQDRIDILKALTKNRTQPVLDEDVSLSSISSMCDGFSGADLSSLVREAGMQSMKESIAKSKTGATSVGARHFEIALKIIRPSVSVEDQKHYDRLRSKYAVISPDGITSMEVNDGN